MEQCFKPHADNGLCAARIMSQHKNRYVLYWEQGLSVATLSGRFRHEAVQKRDYPAVGDWVAIRPSADQTLIQSVLPRSSYFARKPAISGGRKLHNGVIYGGSTEEQIIVANIDTAFIVMGLDGNFNIGRMERYLTLVNNSGASPVVILNKADLCTSAAEYIADVGRIQPGVAVHPISAAVDQSMAVFDHYLLPGRTAVLLGSSGVGKSTIINRLIGEERQKTQTVSDDGKGRHTTTGAELILHPSGYIVVDTAGMRELQLWCDEEILRDSFADVVAIMQNCRFPNCQHDRESGCAIKQALRDGDLSANRFDRYKKLHAEVELLGARQKQWETHRARKRKRG